MVATSLPFWMQQASRTMLPFLADAPARGGSAGPGAPRDTGLLGGAVLVETCPALAIEQHLEAWADLSARALEPNVFLDPAFALPAALHLPPADRPLFLLCWDRGGPSGPALIGLLALQERTSLLQPDVAIAWIHPQWVTSAPLLDRARADLALDAMLGWLASRRATRGGLLVRGIARGGALAELIHDGGRRRVAVLSSHARAVVDNRSDPATARPHARREKEMRRQWRRLGMVELRSARCVDEVRAATELFLDLEARGWKGARRTALLADVALATFTRAMTRLMALRGQCRIDTLYAEGQPVAMAIILRSGDRAYFWKTAYDETVRRLSPGKLLARALQDVQRADPTLTLTDSCAIPDHPMIDAVWPDRMDVMDLLVACPGHDPFGFEGAVARLRLTMRGRAAAKGAYHGLRRVLRR